MMIDDNPMACKLIKSTLESRGYEVSTYLRWTAAYEQIRSGEVDLLLLDINMPDVSGLAVCRALKEDTATKRLPIVFLSTIDEEKLSVHATECGADGYVGKNKGISELTEAITEVVEDLCGGE